MNPESHLERRALEKYSDHFATFAAARWRADSEFKKAEKTFRNVNYAYNRQRDKMIWQITSGLRKNEHLPRHLLDDKNEPKSMIDVFEFYFPDYPRYTLLERAALPFASYVEDNGIETHVRQPDEPKPRFRRELLESTSYYHDNPNRLVRSASGLALRLQ